MTEESNTSNQESTGEQAPGTPEVTMFTQEQVNAFMAEDRRKNAAKYADYDELRNKAAKYDELEAAQQTELEKAQAEAQAAREEKDKALASAQETLIRSAFVAEAAKAGLTHPEDAYALADKSAVTVDDGQVSGVADAVKALVEAGRVPMTKPAAAPNLNGGAGGGERPDDEKPLSDDELKAARRMGVSPEDYQKYKDK